jgi:hypothetical protein
MGLSGAAFSRDPQGFAQASAIWVRGQNANRCASFVSADTHILGLFRSKQLKWPSPDDQTKSWFDFKGIFARKNGAARQD